MTTDRAPEFPAPREAHRWLSPQEVCDELRIPKQTFYQWRARHVAPPAYRFGKLLRIDRAEVEDWLSNHAETFETSPDIAGASLGGEKLTTLRRCSPKP